jgi:multiple sugar transport system permease protein
MAMTSKIGARSPKVRLLYAGMYAFLVCGAVTMVYPFLLMISGSTKSAVDIKYFDVVPRFLRDDAWLYRKHQEALFNEALNNLNVAYDVDETTFEKLELPQQVNAAAVADATAFLDQAKLPPYAYTAGYIAAPQSRTVPLYLRKYKEWLAAKFGTDIDVVNREADTEYLAWNYVTVQPEQYLLRREKPVESRFQSIMNEYKDGQVPAGMRYYFSPEGAFKKLYIKSQYGLDIAKYNAAHAPAVGQPGTTYTDYSQVTLARRVPENPVEARDWEIFLRDTVALHFIRVDASATQLYRDYLAAKYVQIANLNRGYGTQYQSFAEVPLIDEPPLVGMALSDWEAFISGWRAPEVPEDFRTYLAARYGTIAALNQAYGTRHANFAAVPLLEYPRVLQVKYGDIAKFNAKHQTTYANYDLIPLAEAARLEGPALRDWHDFVAGWTDPQTKQLHRLQEYKVPREAMSVLSFETEFQDFLATRYPSIAELNAKYGTSHASFHHVPFPQQDLHLEYFLTHKRELAGEFMTRNYRTVADYMLFHGRAIFNTVVYCALAVLCALLVNPLAAYAMSRYRMPSTYKILLFLLCTMAFPPMVTSIPNFLMLRQLGLLNTFWALILPGLANGYSIFLLKGFFDSQPRELYESAQLDGASEWVLFWQIAMSLSKPILAVIALGAFNGAYANFMFAFVVCQDERMWTLAVWLYQLQQRSGQAVMYASLIIAAIPTFLIFLFCQNIIMRGIVVPSEK